MNLSCPSRAVFCLRVQEAGRQVKGVGKLRARALIYSVCCAVEIEERDLKYVLYREELLDSQLVPPLRVGL